MIGKIIKLVGIVSTAVILEKRRRRRRAAKKAARGTDDCGKPVKPLMQCAQALDIKEDVEIACMEARPVTDIVTPKDDDEQIPFVEEEEQEEGAGGAQAAEADENEPASDEGVRNDVASISN